MLAGWYERTGPADEVISVGQMDVPRPGAGEVLVRLKTSGINPSDYKRRGNAKVPAEFPRVVPHSDGAGVVEALGEGVTGFAAGDRVWVFNAQFLRPWGTAAQYVSLPQFLVRPLPAGVSFEEGSCLGIPAMTAHRAVFSDGPVNGQTIYIPAATGRVGAYAIQFAKWGGARVIASSGSEAGCAVAKEMGADVAFNRAGEDIAARLLKETDGRGPERIVEIDFPNNVAIDEAMIAENGTLVSYGAPLKPTATLTLSPRRTRNLTLRIINVYAMPDAAKDAAAQGVAAAIADGALRHRIAGVVPLEELARAHREAESQAGSGHMIVAIP